MSRFDSVSSDMRMILGKVADAFPLTASIASNDLADAFPSYSDKQQDKGASNPIARLGTWLIDEGYLRDLTPEGQPRRSQVTLTARGLALFGWERSDIESK